MKTTRVDVSNAEIIHPFFYLLYPPFVSISYLFLKSFVFHHIRLNAPLIISPNRRKAF